jgi:hypothetical protein
VVGAAVSAGSCAGVGDPATPDSGLKVQPVTRRRINTRRVRFFWDMKTLIIENKRCVKLAKHCRA